MKKLLSVFPIVVALLFFQGSVSAAWDVESEAELSGDQEVPPVATAMTGDLEIEIEDSVLELEVEDNLHDIFAAHIHCVVPGENGPVGVTLFSGSFTDDEGTLSEGIIDNNSAQHRERLWLGWY
jgi:hypothetical protein